MIQTSFAKDIVTHLDKSLPTVIEKRIEDIAKKNLTMFQEEYKRIMSHTTFDLSGNYTQTFWSSVMTGVVAGGLVRLAATEAGLAFLAWCGFEFAAISTAWALGIGLGAGVLAIPIFLSLWNREKAWGEVVRDYHSNFNKNKIKQAITIAANGEYDRLLQKFVKYMDDKVQSKNNKGESK
jgi:hypothetical protein